MKSLQEFENFYNTDLRPVLEEFETRRLRIRNTFLGISGGLVALLLLLLAVVPDVQVMVILAVVGALIAGGAWWFLTRGFVTEFKHAVVRGVVTFCDPSLRYEPESHIGQGEFMSSLIFKHGIDRYRGEDYVAGKVGDTAVAFSELHAEYKTTTTDSKGNRRTQWHTIFKGLFFKADFSKHFSGTTVVLPDTAERLFGMLGKKLQEMNLNRKDLVKLEDPEFEKLFVVYGSDQVESRYILSTSLMRRITEFKKKTNRPLYLSFVASNVYMAITTGKDMFEPRIFRTLLDFEMCREYLEDLQLALGIVDELNLNTRIWTKE